MNMNKYVYDSAEAESNAQQKELDGYINCEICGRTTYAYAEGKCPNCVRLERHISYNPKAAKKILEGYDKGEER